MEELINNIKTQLQNRVASPLSGAILISWLVYNWRIVIILFSEMKASEKIDYITSYASSNPIGIYAYPLLFAIIYITLYPVPAGVASKISRWHERKLKADQQKIDEATPTLLESALKEISDKNNEIAKLEEKIAIEKNIMSRWDEFLNITTFAVYPDKTSNNFILNHRGQQQDTTQPYISKASDIQDQLIEQKIKTTITQENYFKNYAPLVFAANGKGYIQLIHTSKNSSGHIYYLGTFRDSHDPFAEFKISLNGLNEIISKEPQ